MDHVAADLQHYLQQARDSVLNALCDLSEYDDIGDARWWDDHVGRIRAAADTFK